MITQRVTSGYITNYKGYETFGMTHFEAIKKMLLLINLTK